MLLAEVLPKRSCGGVVCVERRQLVDESRSDKCRTMPRLPGGSRTFDDFDSVQFERTLHEAGWMKLWFS